MDFDCSQAIHLASEWTFAQVNPCFVREIDFELLFFSFQLYSENATMSNFKYCKFYNCLLQSYSIFSFLFYCEFLTIIYSFVIIINHIVVHFILLNIMFKFISFRKFDLKQHNMYFHFWAKRSDFVKLFQWIFIAVRQAEIK